MEKALYKITNLINGKIYIGQTVHPNKRWWEHCYHASAKDDNLPIHLAIAKYGKNNFLFEVLEWSLDYDKREQQLIKEYNSLTPCGYNILEGGGTTPVLKGELHPRNTISDITVDNIYSELYKGELTDTDIAKLYHTTPKIVSDINHGITHKRDNVIYPIRIKKGRTGGISLEMRLSIIYDLQNSDLSYSKIAEKYHISKGMVGHINHGRYNPLPIFNYPIRKKEHINEN